MKTNEILNIKFDEKVYRKQMLEHASKISNAPSSTIEESDIFLLEGEDSDHLDDFIAKKLKEAPFPKNILND